jgi:hypothetical protein
MAPNSQSKPTSNRQIALALVSAMIALCCLPLCCLPLSANASDAVVYPRPTADIDLKVSYPVELLRLALEHAEPTRSLRATQFALPQSRAIEWLQRGHELSVLWTVTSPEREQQMRAIPVPIDRGIYGWRLLLVHQGQQSRFAAVNSLAALAKFTGGQGHDWPDLTVLRHAVLDVYGASSYDGLFEMLARQRIDYYPRAIPEVWPELAARSSLKLTLEPTLVLHYPSAVFFFVRKNDQALADTLQRGLEAAFKDGSFQALFAQQFGDAIGAATLARRRTFTMSNPLLPNLQRQVAPYWWFDPAREVALAASTPATGLAK